MPRRNGVMVDWKHRVNIKQHLSDETEAVALNKTALAIQKELCKLHQRFPAYIWPGFELRDIETALIDAQNLEDFNSALEDLYNWADDNLVWLG